MNRVIAKLTLSALALAASLAEAKVIPDAMFADNMVLQQDTAVSIWGLGEPGETVSIEFAGQKKTTRANEEGTWMLRLDPMKASFEPRELRISSAPGMPRTTLTNVVVGEVWLGAGQSNMAYGTRHFTPYDPDLKAACLGGPYLGLRVYLKEGWQLADTNSLHNFSALLFSFGHALQNELNVPVGLMVAARGGTPSGQWLTEEMANASPAFVSAFNANSGYNSFAEMKADWTAKRAEWKLEVKRAKTAGQKPPRFSHPAQPLGDLYKKHVQPFVPYAIRGVLWDQGESGTKVPGVDQYTTMEALIAGWRKAWGMADFPFLHMQKTSGGGCAWDADSPDDRKPPLPWVPLPLEPLPDDRSCEKNLQHIKMRTIRNAPLVTTADLAPGVHPPTKYSYGKRACQVALGAVYGRDIVRCGPVYKSHTVQSHEVRIAFDNIGKGLAFRHGDRLQGFELAGADLKWTWADARIEGATVVVSSKAIREPLHVRYAFNRTFNWANLFNRDGLPALMFTTGPQ